VRIAGKSALRSSEIGHRAYTKHCTNNSHESSTKFRQKSLFSFGVSLAEISLKQAI